MKNILKISIISCLAFLMPVFVFAAEVRDIVFPVDGENHFEDTFGDPRSGGRTHEGTDIMTDKMTPLVAAVDGYIEYITETEQYWGYALYIEDEDGYSYRYIHINNDTPGTDDGNGGYDNAFAPGIKRGSQVKAGQLVAYAGDSGNAENAGSHLHFEIRTPNGTAINSYPSLVAATQIKTPAGSYKFTRDLELEDEGPDVKELQKYLNTAGFTVSSSGPGSPGNETDYFGEATQAALIKFQQAKGISPAAGYFGPVTRNFINSSQTVLGYKTEDQKTAGLQVGSLVKNLKYAEVFYVSENLELCWIINEAAAEKHFGPAWNQIIQEYEDLNVFNLKFGENLK